MRGVSCRHLGRPNNQPEVARNVNLRQVSFRRSGATKGCEQTCHKQRYTPDSRPTSNAEIGVVSGDVTIPGQVNRERLFSSLNRPPDRVPSVRFWPPAY
jgi:hypothetical protein